MNNIFPILLVSFGLLTAQTDVEIKRAKVMIKKTGMNEAEARAAAKAQGYSDAQIDAAIQKELDAKKTDGAGLQDIGKSNKLDQVQPVGETTQLTGGDQQEIMGEDELEVIDEKLNLVSKNQPGRQAVSYFGYDIFKRDPSVFQASSVGAVDPDYLIGPGDEIIVMLWGETQFRQVLAVDKEGFVFISEIGQVFVNGLDLSLLESKLFRVLSQSYASLNPEGRKPTTFLDVSLGNLRPLRIQVLGEVAQPGAYTVSPSTTLFSALYYFNGPTTLGSLRDIRLNRAGKEISSIDFYDYLLTGKKPSDEKLQLDDVIFIPGRLKTVSLFGEINRPGIYELKPNEDLSDLISIAGGLKITAYLDRAQIDRIVPFEDRADIEMDRMFTDVNLDKSLKAKKGFPLQDGDRIQIFSIFDLRKNVVDLRGAVTRPGSYDLGESLSLSELIVKADNLLGDAYMDRVDIIRINPNYTEQLIKLDLKKVLSGNSDHDILLQGMDQVRVYSMTEMVPRTYVSITGHVKQSGRHLLRQNMTLYDLIFKAGGFVDEVFKKGTYLDRAELVRISQASNEKEIIPFNLGLVINQQGMASTPLRTDDAVRIYSVNEIEGEIHYVSITGHVKRAGRYELFEENMTLNDLIFKAGGFDDDQFKAQTYLERADLIRIDEDQITRTIIPFNLENVLADKDSKLNFHLLPGDKIRIYSKTVFNNVRRISIDGTVRSPGTYSLKTKMTVKDLILEAGGVSEDVYRYKIEVARIDPDKVNETTYAEIIELDMYNDYKIINSNPGFAGTSIDSTEFKLKPYDYVSVRPDPFFKMHKKVTVTGAVHYPGVYTLINPNEKLTDIIMRAGGLHLNAYAEASTLTRHGQIIRIGLKRILDKPRSKINIVMQDGDNIFVAMKPDMIQIQGEVASPGIYKFLQRKRVNDFIDLSGGFSMDAEKKDVWITFPDGKSQRYRRWLSNPIVLDGSVITVGRKEDVEPFDITEFSKEVASIMADLAQVAVLIIITDRNN